MAFFENPEFGTVRTATDEKDEPWFCAKDLCDVLGYKRADLTVKQYVRSSDAAKRCVARLAKNRYGVCEGKMQVVQMNFVNESGFYALMVNSRIWLHRLMNRIQAAENREESIWITIL